MEIEERSVGDGTILCVKGKLLIGSLTEKGEMLRQVVERHVKAGSSRIAMDLAGVPYLDSAGLGEIVHCYTITKRQNSKFKLINVPKQIPEDSTELFCLFVGDDDEDWPS